MAAIALNDQWYVKEAPLCRTKYDYHEVINEQGEWMPCSLPCDVRIPLQNNGRIPDPVEADHCFESEWIERRSWWFARKFTLEVMDETADAVELAIDSIDAYADIFVNGIWIGAHESAHYPFVAQIKGKLVPGDNLIVLRVTTGFERVCEQDVSQIEWAVCHEGDCGNPGRGDYRRALIRKPQYVAGWDWAPRVITCGIMKDVSIQIHRKTAIRAVHVATKLVSPSSALLEVEVEVEQLHLYATREGSVKISVKKDQQLCAEKILVGIMLCSGLNYYQTDIEIANPQLWWPAGYGAQPLYEVCVEVCCEGSTVCHPSFEYGIRKITLDMTRDGVDSRQFTFVVNDVPIFCKGANWIPADSVYARVSNEKYETMVREACAAGFNMLRVWGGGIYERDVFYTLCDRLGILVWQDFMFACSAYPDHIAHFRDETERELEYQTRRLRNRASLAVFCGNNENHQIFNPEDDPSWKIDMRYEKSFGLHASNIQARRAVWRNCPEIPFWNSSPYGGDLPNSDKVGDVHHWHACMMHKEMAVRIDPAQYDRVQARFVSEYGYPGPCPVASIKQYFGKAPIDRSGKIWKLHTNTFEKDTVKAGIEKHYIDDASALSLEDYVLYGGLTQSLMLEYSLEALRFKETCSGAMFWMYNDTWGEVGWSIMDYYTRRKISFYGVKRAFAPVKLTMRRVDGKIRLQGCNDTPKDILLERARIGYLRFDGSVNTLKAISLCLPAHSRTYLGTFDFPDEDYTNGSFVLLTGDDEIDSIALRVSDTKDLVLPQATIRTTACKQVGEDLHIVLESDGYAVAVHTEENYKSSDNYFELLPGQKKKIVVEACEDSNLKWKTLPCGGRPKLCVSLHHGVE